MATIKRRTAAEQFDFHTEQAKKWKQKMIEERNSPKSKLNKDSSGVQDAIAALEKVVIDNKSSMGEVIKLISRIKRTGLQIGDPKKKIKKIVKSKEHEVDNQESDDEVESKEISVDEMIQAIRERRKSMNQNQEKSSTL